MNSIKKSDIKLLIDTQSKFKFEASDVSFKDSTWWELEILTENNGLLVRNKLINKAGEIRRFKKIESIVNFIKDICPEGIFLRVKIS